MIIDLLQILVAFLLGYGIFMLSAYLLAKWMLPKIEDGDELVHAEPEIKQIRRAVSENRYLARAVR